MNSKKHIRGGLACVSFAMTGAFGFSLSSGVTALLFSVSMVLIQMAALLHLPEKFLQAKSEDCGVSMALYGGAIVGALLLSVTASVATLSGSYERDAQAMREHETLQAAVDGYLEAGYITRSLEVQKQLEALPEIEVTPLMAAANRIEALTGIDGASLVSGFISTLALMLDGFVILLAGNAVTPLVTPVTHYPVTQESHATEPLPPEVQTVLQAMDDGLITKPSVREVRELLRCSQSHAIRVSQLCRQLELSLS